MPKTKTQKAVTAATYIRMSTTKQDASPERQRREIAAFLKRQGYEAVAEYADLGRSGDDTTKRPQFRKMMVDAAAGFFDRIIVWDNSRLGRFDSLEAGRWFAPLRDAGVTVESVTGGVADWDDFGPRVTEMIRQETDHAAVVATSRGTVSGQTRKASEANGFYGGPTPYGYRRVPVRRAPVGKAKSKWVGDLEIDPETAPTVQRIFELYAHPRGSIRQVCEQLNREGVPAPRGGRWFKNTVARLLANRVYIGDYVWGRRQTGKYHTRDGTAGVKRRKRSDPVTFTDPIIHKGILPRIVSDDLWGRVQQAMIDRQRETMAPIVRKTLSGLVICRNCGLPMRADGGTYRCASSDPQGGGGCRSYRVPENDLLPAVMGALSAELKGPQNRAAVRKALEAAVGRRAGDDALAKELRRRLQDVGREIRQGTARMAQVPDSLVAGMVSHLEGLASQKEKLEADLHELETRSTGRAGAKAAVDSVMESLDTVLQAAAAGNGDPVVVNGLLKRAGVTVEVTPTPSTKRKGERLAWLKVLVPLVTIVATLWPPAAATSRARLAASCPRTSAKSMS